MIARIGPAAAAPEWSIKSRQTSAPSTNPGAPAPADSRDQASSEKLQNARNALATLRQVRAGMGRSGKDAAIQKLAELKARLKSLMLLGGDPKTRAREAAAIAGEIAAAARDYAAGGGSPSEVAAASATPATPEDVVQSPASPEAPPAGAAPAEATVAGQAASTGAVGQGPTQAAASGTSPTQDSGPNDADRQFIEEARRLAQQAKAIIERAAHPDRRAKGAALSHEDAGAGQAALQAVDDAARSLGLDGGAAALTATSGVAGATLSIKA